MLGVFPNRHDPSRPCQTLRQPTLPATHALAHSLPRLVARSVCGGGGEVELTPTPRSTQRVRRWGSTESKAVVEAVYGDGVITGMGWWMVRLSRKTPSSTL